MKLDGPVRHLATAIVAMAFVGLVSEPAQAGTISQEIRRYVHNIPSKNELTAYNGYVKSWCDTLEKEEPRKADDHDILALVSILRIDMPGINLCAANYLNAIGPRAHSAVIRLQKLYDFLMCGKEYDMSGSDVIRQALHGIGVRHVLASCERGRHFPEITSPPNGDVQVEPPPPPPDPPKDNGK